MSAHLPYLSLLIASPILAGFLALAFGDDSKPDGVRWFALIVMLINACLCVPLLKHFSIDSYSMQFVEAHAWLSSFGIRYDLGVDGLSLAMVVLSIFTTITVLLCTWQSIDRKVSQYLAAFLIMQGLMVGVFSAMDSILFYVFWEATLIPMYLIIGVWGSSNRVYAAIKFFLYTFLGSVLMLVAFIYMGVKAGSFAIADLYHLKLSLQTQILIFIAFFMAFAVKVPMWPVHTWLPDAHTEAPAGGSIVLAAMLLKLGAYGFLRFSLPITPDASKHLAVFMITLSLIAIIYIALIAIVQRDMKKLIAYSSISHMGFVTLGCFLVYLITAHGGSVKDASLGLDGAVFVMISHAFVSGAMFAGVGYLYDRMHSRQIKDFGGVVNSMPVFASFYMLFAMANAGLPGTSGFVGEFMVILSSFKAGFWIAFLAATTLIFGAAYTLWMYKRVFFGQITNKKVSALKDIKGFELAGYSLLAVCVLLFGIYPAPVLHLLHASLGHILDLSQLSKI